MTKQEIVQIMNQEYDRIGKEVYIDGLREQLEETRRKFPRTFDYPLASEYDTKGKMKHFIKRLIRKSIRFVLKPYAEQMNEYENSMYQLQRSIIDALDKSLNNK